MLSALPFLILLVVGIVLVSKQFIGTIFIIPLVYSVTILCWHILSISLTAGTVIPITLGFLANFVLALAASLFFKNYRDSFFFPFLVPVLCAALIYVAFLPYAYITMKPLMDISALLR